ncbi:5-3 exoribonuclease [Cichlidogyrus casuarinus]|uniref:5'-3' exoribonuclease n=1 Tax=Cichlidogyrus casuarinus TaxID=1844966 RepID=A0ABD2Q4T0_9PLAT
MGVPAFFRWLSQKYPSIVSYAKETTAQKTDKGESIPIDWSTPNPNGQEYDNLYLDMNGIIHPCTHPENKPAPKNEPEMFLAIFEYIDRLLAIVRPRRVLYMAIDGVAPRAKMNQQRSRRFRAAKETREKLMTMDRIRSELEEKGASLPPPKDPSQHFDSNCITPGTPFMASLATALRYYIYDRLNSDPAWRGLQVYLSDANVPGEGEHKIMNFIRRQRAAPDHDANTKHCLCGADADLIMLGLATHEVQFTIIREEFKPNQPRPCELCGQLGHDMANCVGCEAEDTDKPLPAYSEVEFIFIHLSVLRQYLETDLRELMNLPFEFDFERAIDDWVFMCFFVGNDFLPHLPSLEIREGAIDRLIKLYKETISETGGWLTDSGEVNLPRVEKIMLQLGLVEDEIFRNRRNDEMQFRDRNRRRGASQQRSGSFNHSSPLATARTPSQIRRDNRVEMSRSYSSSQMDVVEKNLENLEAASALKAMLKRTQSNVTNAPPGFEFLAPENRKRERISASSSVNSELSDLGRPSRKQGKFGGVGYMELENIKKANRMASGPSAQDDDEIADKCDEVRLWEEGFRSRYYSSKFGVDIVENPDFPALVAKEYVKGLCWVLAYYYQGCVSWDWYYPYHYAPFASDFTEIAEMEHGLRSKKTQPFKPLEQLMSVFPADSRDHVPETWRTLMTDPESPIIDFYPTDFKIDLNGKRYLWMGVALLPFVDEVRLMQALDQRRSMLSEGEKVRNIRGPDRLFIHEDHPIGKMVKDMYKNGKIDPLDRHDPDLADCLHPDYAQDLLACLTQGITGKIWPDEQGIAFLPGEKIPELPNCAPAILPKKQFAISCSYTDPVYPRNFIFPAVLLPSAKIPEPVTLLPATRGRGRGGGRSCSRDASRDRSRDRANEDVYYHNR